MKDIFRLNPHVKKAKLGETLSVQEDREYWLNQTPENRILAVEYLRNQFYADSTGLPRIARVIKRTQR